MAETNDIRRAPQLSPRKLRLLVVSSDTYPPTRVDVAVLYGVELAGRGHEIDWILQSEAACRRTYETHWGGGRVWVGATDLGSALLHRIKKHMLGIANDWRIFSRLRHGSYDAVQVKDKFLSGIFAMIASRLYRAKFIYWLSYPFPEDYLLRAKDGTARYPLLYTVRGLVFKWLLYRWLLPAADHVFVQSEQMRQDLAQEGIPLQKMTPVPMGISPAMGVSPGVPVERRLMPPGVPCVLYLGALGRVRRLDFLIRAFGLVTRTIPEARLYLVGRGNDPSDEAFLEGEAAALDLQASVFFVGQLPQAQAMQYVLEADVCVSPLYPTPVLRASSPTKLVEYMAMGKAVVGNDLADQKRVIEESGAGYCVPYEEPAFAEALVNLLRHPEMARQMGRRGRRYAIEHRSYGVIADGVEGRLVDIVEARC